MPVFRIGVDDFQELIDEGGYFVDKSLLIREVIEGNKVVLLPRPRRFGKTLNMTMLRYFFERSDEDRRYLFQNLAIASYPDCMQHQGQYPVIFISLKDVKGTTWNEMRNRLIEKIAELLIPLPYLRPDLPPIYQRGFDALYTGTPDDATLKASLKNLITWLYTFHKKPVIVLIDEYDTPMIEGWQNGYYDKIADFLRSWLGGGLKHENAHALYRAVITGILRVAKESIFSGLNNLFVSTSLLPNTLSTLFGFTEEEVLQILRDFGRLDQADIVRDWYDGYRFGSQTIYNPWSVSMYISQYPAPPAPYWLNTASNTLVYEELGKGGIGIKQDLEQLLSGEIIRYPITETITFRDIGKNPAHIWSFLYFSGYLRAEDPRFADYNPTLLTYALSIPNLEISTAYQQFVNNIFGNGDTTAGMKSFVSFFLPPLWSGNL
ncbi:MAG TPA: AAA family ATPase [Methanospirillum sp.]|uniref:AAA family ATPase n=1 Tax=Methanospirillum sp. TaxID=45200 RepID=UPI002BF451B2|nr:AAA family ATPase [Methanospirillum sp.]HOJ96407.1 AAA family ATPase [Methanospirillum sp.]